MPDLNESAIHPGVGGIHGFEIHNFYPSAFIEMRIGSLRDFAGSEAGDLKANMSHC
jgi:hypothetical protein